MGRRPGGPGSPGAFEDADTPLAPNTEGFDPSVASHGYGHSPEQARARLAAAGIDPQDEIVLLTADSNTYRELAAEVVGQLAAVGPDSHPRMRRAIPTAWSEAKDVRITQG